MDYFPENLYKLIRYYDKMNFVFPETLAKIYAYQLIRGINYLKIKGYCHRDIKPQNILINTGNHWLCLCDFGSAKQLQKGEPSTSYICSRYYRAPELLFGNEQYDTKVDVWSVGCVLAEFYWKRPVFPGKNTQDQLFRIAGVLGKPSKKEMDSMNPGFTGVIPEASPTPLKKLFKDFSPLVVDLLTKMLRYDPKERIDPIDALLHPYFDSLRSSNLKINGRQIANLFDFSEEELGGCAKKKKELIPNWYKEEIWGKPEK